MENDLFSIEPCLPSPILSINTHPFPHSLAFLLCTILSLQTQLSCPRHHGCEGCAFLIPCHTSWEKVYTLISRLRLFLVSSWKPTHVFVYSSCFRSQRESTKDGVPHGSSRPLANFLFFFFFKCISGFKQPF